jgi:hypothetical protein
LILAFAISHPLASADLIQSAAADNGSAAVALPVGSGDTQVTAVMGAVSPSEQPAFEKSLLDSSQNEAVIFTSTPDPTDGGRFDPTREQIVEVKNQWTAEDEALHRRQQAVTKMYLALIPSVGTGVTYYFNLGPRAGAEAFALMWSFTFYTLTHYQSWAQKSHNFGNRLSDRLVLVAGWLGKSVSPKWIRRTQRAGQTFASDFLSGTLSLGFLGLMNNFKGFEPTIFSFLYTMSFSDEIFDRHLSLLHESKRNLATATRMTIFQLLSIAATTGVPYVRIFTLSAVCYAKLRYVIRGEENLGSIKLLSMASFRRAVGQVINKIRNRKPQKPCEAQLLSPKEASGDD